MVPEYPTTSVHGNRDPRWQYSTMTSSAFDISGTDHYSLKSTVDVKLPEPGNRKERRAAIAKMKHGKSKHNKSATRRW
jgi:hypothetical protein